MSRKKNYLFIVMIICSLTAFSQEPQKKQYEVKRNALSFNMGGISPVFGITYERLLSEKLSIEFGVGLPSIGLGFKSYPKGIRKQKAIFHWGLSWFYYNSGDGELTGSEGSVLYVPLGISYIGKKGFNFGADLGPGRHQYRFGSDLIPYGSIRFGKRF